MIRLDEFAPLTRLEVSRTACPRARFPVFDAHNHLARPNDPSELVDRMDRFNIRTIVDLDGWWGGVLEDHLERYLARYPGRFRVFCRVDASGIDEPGFGRRAAAWLRECRTRGASGVKFSKSLGVKLTDRSGRFVRPDDPRLVPVWETAADLAMPVTIHIADPVAFFLPIDATNERYEELEAHPHWSYHGRGCPSFEELLESQRNLMRHNPRTTFIVAHVGSYAENLTVVGSLLDTFPNMYVDTAERIAELGRQPYTARAFLVRYADRVLYGTDLLPNETNTSANYRFFETRDEYFPYNSREEHNQGRWMIYGVGLDDDVLRKIYFENAERLMGQA